MPSQLDPHHKRRKASMVAAIALLSSSSARAFTIPSRRSIAAARTRTDSSPLAFLSTSKSLNNSFVNCVFPESETKSWNKGNAKLPCLHMSTTSAESTSTGPNTQLGKDTKYDIKNKGLGIIGKYEPQLFESQIYKWWEDAGCFKPDAKQTKEDAKANGREPYVLPMPPPNVTGRLHMGHAIFVALQDVLARFHRMRGRPVLWLPGKCDMVIQWRKRFQVLLCS